MLKRTLSTIALTTLVIACLALFGCGSSGSGTQDQTETSTDQIVLVEEGTLCVGSDLAYPPFESLENGEASGFTIDIMNALCEKMGLTCKYLDPLKFDTLIPLVASNAKIDAAAASITITDEREEEVDFTDPYLDSNQSIVVLNTSAIQSEDDIVSGMTVGVQSGTTGESWAQENLTASGATVTAFDDITSAFAALEAGKIDAIVNDLPVDQWMVKNSYTDAKIIAEIPTGEQYGIAVSKDNPALTAALNEALASIKADGTYDEIYTKWFG